MRAAKPAKIEAFVPPALSIHFTAQPARLLFCALLLSHGLKKTKAGRKMRSAKQAKSKPLSVDFVDLNEFDAASCLQTRTAKLQKKSVVRQKNACSQTSKNRSLCAARPKHPLYGTTCKIFVFGVNAFFCIVLVDIFQAM